MRWPRHAVETVRPSRFLPPFCPHAECAAHVLPGQGFVRNGWYRRKNDPKRIPRFNCRDCGRSCSRQTFSTTYYLKRPELLVAVASGLAACSAHRQIARSNDCAKTSVTRMAERLGRHAILFHGRCRRVMAPIGEVIVHDHFETFIGRQDRALGIGTAVGARSWFIYDIDPAPHRGSGRRPDRKPEQGAPPSDRSYARSIQRTFRGLISQLADGERLICNVDGRNDYRVVMAAPALSSRVSLRIYPNPKRGPKGAPRTPEARERDEAMFPVDKLHQFLRHTCSDHKRETIAFGRRLESIVGRAHLIAVWKNFIKRRTERRRSRSTPAMQLGLTDTRWRWERVLARRLFREREQVSEIALTIYRKSWTRGWPSLTLKRAA